MKKEEVKILMEILKTAYPSNYRQMSSKEMQATLTLYYGMFHNYPLEVIKTALMNYIRVNQYPQTIAGIQEQIDYLTCKGNTEAELWNKLSEGIKGNVAFEKLPIECQMWVGSARDLKDLGQVDINTVNTVVRGEFLKSIKTIKQRQKAVAEIPMEIKLLLKGENQ